LLDDWVAMPERPRFVRAAEASVRSLRFDALASLPPMVLEIVVENDASEFKAEASSATVLRASGAPFTRLATAVITKEVFAIFVEESPAV
jgi:hypothetical protein